MRAVRFHTVGGPDVLRVEKVPRPGPPSGDELLARVEASSVNGTDLGLHRGVGEPYTARAAWRWTWATRPHHCARQSGVPTSAALPAVNAA